VSCLVEGNQAWAKRAPVLALGVVSLQFKRNGKPNAAAQHDLGLASANLTLEATKRGLSVHQMIGVLPDHAKTVFGVPDGYRVLTGLAIGYSGDPQSVEGLGDRDRAARSRLPIAEFVFSTEWGTSFAEPV
jgi:nitroreductase